MNHFISLEQAAQMTTVYRQEKEKILQENLRDKNILPISETFDRSAFDRVLSQPGCTGLRIYYGMKGEAQIHAIIVATDEKGEDLLSASDAVTSGTSAIIEAGTRCPDICPPTSALNP